MMEHKGHSEDQEGGLCWRSPQEENWYRDWAEFCYDRREAIVANKRARFFLFCDECGFRRDAQGKNHSHDCRCRFLPMPVVSALGCAPGTLSRPCPMEETGITKR